MVVKRFFVTRCLLKQRKVQMNEIVVWDNWQ